MHDRASVKGGGGQTGIGSVCVPVPVCAVMCACEFSHRTRFVMRVMGG